MRRRRGEGLLLTGLGLALSMVLLAGARSCLVRSNYRERVLLLSEDDPRLRVALVRDAPSLELAVPGPHEVTPEGGPGSVASRPSQDRITISARGGRIVWGGERMDSGSARIVPAAGGSVEINGTLYRGAVRIVADRKGAVTAVNEIGLETYLAGVLGGEVPTTWPDSALRAQAIAARTYALQSAWQRRNASFDLTADTLSQVYRGLEVEDQTAFRIVHETRGVILTYGGKVFSTFYMSVCGGHTASSAKVFGAVAIPPLSGTTCEYCRGAPRYRWPDPGKRIYFSEEEILTALRPLGVPFDRLEAIEGLQMDPEGFAARVSLRKGGETFTVSAKDFRMALGPGRLYSTAFRAERRGGGFLFRGKGWGHGVGLCQWGAYGMARAGFGEREILLYYYPGAELIRISGKGPG